MRLALLAGLLLTATSAVAAILMLPSDTDHARATPPEVLAAFADPPGAGPLDGTRFDTRMGPQGKPAEIDDFVQFDSGLFMSQECEDRCNYPPSAYYARQTPAGHDFVVEAFCPTKETDMVWRGRIAGDEISGTVTWTVRRFYWTHTQVLSFSGTRSDRRAAQLGGP
ncbi:hypothetical protein DXV76_07325 [Rhodobacteraceae bacterium CCMM004]|nr:hypothetical protein DXV76_07325 [Rhodobacteraceae bacterium CCMM004]